MAKPRILPSISPLYMDRQRIRNFLEIGKNYKVTYLKASAGYGKTTAVLSWLSDKEFKNVFWFQIRSIDNYPDEFFNHFFVALVNKLGNPSDLVDLIDSYKENIQFNSDVSEWITRFSLSLEEGNELFYFIFDDLHLLSEYALNVIYTFILSSPENYRFIFTSRNNIPMEFSDLVVKSKVYVIPPKTFNFTKEETKNYFKSVNIDLNDKQLNDIIEFTGGRVSAYSAINVSIAQSDSDDDLDIKKLMNNEYITEFLKKNLWNNLNMETKKVFSIASLFDEINTSMLQSIIGFNVKKILDDFADKMGYLIKNDENTYIMYPEFKELVMSMNELSDYDKRKYYSLGAKYYLALGNKNKALRIMFYSKNYDEAADVLTQIARNNDEYINNEIAKNMIFELPVETIAARPDLMKIAVLNSLDKFDIEKANYWLSKLKSFTNNIINLTEKREAMTLINYLSLNMPSENVNKKLVIIRQSIEQVKNGQIRSFNTAYTRGFPSVISPVYGSFTTIDQKIIANMMDGTDNIAVILPKYGNKVVNVAKAEFMYERFKINDTISLLNNVLKNDSDIIIDLLFVIRALLFKSYICLGKNDLAVNELILCKKEIDKKGTAKMLRNYRDFIVRYSILRNEKGVINEWLASSLDENEPFIITDLFHFKSKVYVYLYLKEYYKALRLAEILIDKYNIFYRYIDLVEMYAIKGSCHHALGEMELRNESILSSLKIAMKYDFKTAYIYITNFINECMYSFYREYKLSNDERSFLGYIIDEQRRFLSFHSKLSVDNSKLDDIKLTKTEIIVLNLIEEGFSNKDICDSLKIKEPTVKTHISNILSKLGVKNRTQAVKVAKEKSFI